MSALPKPQLRNLHLGQIKRNLVGMVLFASTCALSWKLFVVDPARNKMDEFYKNYDDIKALDRMNAAGYMQSCPPEQYQEIRKLYMPK